MGENKQMVFKKSWDQFRDTKLLWWCNRMLHLFGWAIVVELDDSGNVKQAYPARVKFRGFSEEVEERGFIGLTEFLKVASEDLAEEVKEEGIL